MKYHLLTFFLLWFMFAGMTPLGSDVSSANRSAETVPASLTHRSSGVTIDPSQYCWPTDASSRLTSSFGEYRTMHFHGGIDISTNGVVGYNVFAVRDGYVTRVRIEANGYGKMIFVKHPDGYSSVYVHLQRFSDKIEQVIHQEQLRRGSYVIDKTFETPIIPVQKGEVIAYTGDTGVGPPHLHFEIRDEHLDNVNPLFAYPDSLIDKIPPAITGVAIFPEGMNSTIDGKQGPKYMGKLRRGRGLYKIPQSIRVHGTVGFAIRGYDRANGVSNKFGIYRMELYVDSVLTFVKQIDRFPSYQTKQIYLDYDYATILEGKGEFQKLYAEEGSTLPFYEHFDGGNGTINTQSLTEGIHTYRIVCKDFKDNTSTLDGTLFINHTPDVKLTGVENGTIQLQSIDAESLTKFSVSGKKLAERNWTQTGIKKENIRRDGNTIHLAYNAAKYDIVKVLAQSKAGIEAPLLVHFNKKPQGPPMPVALDVKQAPGFLTLKISTKGTFTAEPLLTVKEGISERSIPVSIVSLTEYGASFIPSPASTGNILIEVVAEVNGIQTRQQDMVSVYSLSPQSSGSFSLGKNGLIVSYDSGSVYHPMLLSILDRSTPTAVHYELSPSNVILNGGVRVSVPLNPAFLNGKYGLFFRGNGGWVFQTSTPDPDNSYFSTNLSRTLGEVTIMRDEQPPSIARLRVTQSKGFVSGGFRYSDNLSGVNFEEVKIYIDDQIIIPEIDDEHHRVWFKSSDRLPAGKHLLTVTMKDRMNNESKVTRAVTVKSSSPAMP